MRIEIRILADARAELLRILERRTPTRVDALAFAQVYLQDIEQQLRLHHGPPPNAELWFHQESAVWWEYVLGV